MGSDDVTFFARQDIAVDFAVQNGWHPSAIREAIKDQAVPAEPGSTGRIDLVFVARATVLLRFTDKNCGVVPCFGKEVTEPFNRRIADDIEYGMQLIGLYLSKNRQHLMTVLGEYLLPNVEQTDEGHERRRKATELIEIVHYYRGLMALNVLNWVDHYSLHLHLSKESAIDEARAWLAAAKGFCHG